MKRKWTAMLSLLLAVMMTACFMPQAAFADGEGGGDVQPPEKIEQPYMTVDFAGLADQNALVLKEGMDGTAVSKEPHGYGALIKGPVSELKNGKVEIASKFDFTGNPVTRISMKGVAERGVLVDAKIYLDDDPEPVCTVQLDNRSRSGGWNTGEMSTVYVYDKDKEIRGEHKVSIGFDIAGKSDEQEAGILLREIEFVEDSGIPTLYFNDIGEGDGKNAGTVEEMNTSADHSVRCYGGSVDIKVPEGYKSEYESSSMEDTSIGIEYIRGRGNSTWGADKKAYRLKLDAGDVDLFGMGSNAHWVLLANRFDNSLLRNRMTYWLGAAMGMEFTPQCVPVDVVMNGEYYGSYLLCEHIRVGGSRVEIDKLKKSNNTLPDISGGYLLRMSPYDGEDERNVFTTKQGAVFINSTPDFAEDYENDNQKNYIRGYVQDTEDAVFGEDFKNSEGESYRDYLDFESAVNYWWVQEFSMNGDAYITDSTYLYKKRNGKLFWGPLWDFDYVAWGDLQQRSDPQVTGFDNTSMPWFDHMLADPVFTGALIERWGDIDALVTEIVKEGGILDQYYEQTKISERYDHEKYGYYGDEEYAGNNEDVVPYPGDEHDDSVIPDPNRPYIDEVDQLREWVAARQLWVNSNIDSLSSLAKEVTFIVDGNAVKTVYAKELLRDTDLPDAPEKDGYVFEGWYTKPEGGEKIMIGNDSPSDDDSMRIDKDMTFYAHFVEEGSASKADKIYICGTVFWADITEETYTPLFTVLPTDAVDRRVTWTSSNEEKATVDKRGKVTLLNTGKVTITGTLTTGESASYVLNIYDPKETTLKKPTDIELENDQITIEMGSYGFNQYKLLPEEGPVQSDSVFYESDDESIVVAGPAGELYPISPGTTTVTVYDFTTDISASFEVTVVCNQNNDDPDDAPIDAIDNAIAVLMQMNKLVNKADYTKASYNAYYAVYKKALERLKGGSVTLEEVSELRHKVILAQLDLVKKKANTMKVKAKKVVKVKRSKVKRKAVTIKRSKAITIKNAKGKVTYAKVAKGSSKRLSINKKTGKIKVKKKTKKGLYRIKVQVKAAGNGNYRPMTKIVTVKVRVR